MTTSVRPVATIDQELADLNAKIAPGEQAIERAKKAAAALEEQRRGVLVAARLDGDRKALKQLETLTPKVDRAALEVRDSEAVLDEIHVRTKKLTGERGVAVRVEGLESRKRIAKEQRQISKKADSLLAELVGLGGKWCDLGLAIYQVSSDLGEPLGRTPRQALSWVVGEAFSAIAPDHFKRSPLRGVSFSLLAEQFAPAEPDKLEKAS